MKTVDAEIGTIKGASADAQQAYAKIAQSVGIVQHTSQSEGAEWYRVGRSEGPFAVLIVV